MSYQYLSEDDKVYKIKHPDGSEFSVAKNALSKKMHEKIQAMKPQNMADGGFVEDKEFIEDNKNPLVIEPVVSNQNVPLNISPVLPNEPVLQEPVISPNRSLAQEQVPQDLNTNLLKDYADNFALKESGIKQAARAESRLAKDQAIAYQNQYNQLENTVKIRDQKRDELDKEHGELIKAIQDQKLDSNRLWHNMSTGNKVLSAISVALSGIGSGLTGQPNAAMAVIQKSIDRDIEDQKAELGKKKTLLSENLRRYGDLDTANQATMLQLNALTQAKINQFAAKSNNIKAQAAAKQLTADLGLQAAALKQNLSQKLAINQSLDPVTRQIYQKVPEKLREKAIEEKGIIDNLNQAKTQINDLITNADKAAMVGSFGSIPGTSAAKQIDQTEAQLRSLLQANWKGPMTDEESKKIVGPYLPSVTDNKQDVENKIKGLQDMLQRNAKPTPILSGHSVSYQMAPAAEIKTMNGIQYQKVPGGWKKVQ